MAAPEGKPVLHSVNEITISKKSTRNGWVSLLQCYRHLDPVPVEKQAQLCITADVKILYKNKNGSFKLLNGPYHRRFLDGYFPFHLTLKVIYPNTHLKYIKSKPQSQPGFKIRHSKNTLIIDTYFTGKLNTEIEFKHSIQ